MAFNQIQKKQLQRQIELYEKQKGVSFVSIPFRRGKLKLTIDRFVANPAIMNSGIQVVQFLVSNPYLVRGKIVTDMGTGCGIIGIAAAKLGARKVYMPDIDPSAIENAKRNIALHHLKKVCESYPSNLFSKQANRKKADVQIFNHPFFTGKPIKGKEWTRMMLSETSLLDKYFEQAPHYSAPDATYILPWLNLARNEKGIDNDPGKRASRYGYDLIDVIEQAPVRQGIQQSHFRIYVFKRGAKK